MSLEIRPITIDECDTIGLITVTAFLSAYIGRIPEADLDFTWTPEVSAEHWRNEFKRAEKTGGNIMAAVDESIVGVIEYGPAAEASTGWIGSLYVLPTRQGEGIGKALLEHAAHDLHSLGFKSLELSCARENPNRGFYEHLGAVEVRRKPGKIDHYETEEITYRWQNIADLL